MNEPDPGPIRVCLVDDHAVVRRGLRGYLDLVEDIEVVGEAGDGQAALDTVAALVAEQRAPHVVLMDLLMPGLDGVTATRLLTQQYEDIAVMAMTSYSEVERIRSALEAGASGYLLKDAEADEVADGIRKAHRREMPLGAAVSRQLARAFSATGQAALGTLTAREHEVLLLIAAGMSNREIASRLVISERTARTHVSSILEKLELRSRTQAALYAIQHGVAPAHPSP
ncbi:two component transcriptional regulator, LuxR family [Geodermatophilus amargosae]|uniref:Two component transcriptional regulator, LuxR family n=1 Tax=Geodermatophilus amargosae TaxID=1296565 RepID=A0A1I7D6U8_9ACTN|nr:response regulator transcription factor [Geodermatophilus amargosae]SFU07406.1 two component transcriptional regulator, LuxR family [Geodermatophilus amargosae]